MRAFNPQWRPVAAASTAFLLACAAHAAEPDFVPSAEVLASSPVPASATVASPAPVRSETAFDGIDGGEQGQLLVDSNGLRLGGTLARGDGADASDRVAAELAGASREASRATRLLGLGGWHVLQARLTAALGRISRAPARRAPSSCALAPS